MPEKTLPNPNADGTCTVCNISDFTLAQDKTEMRTLSFGETKPRSKREQR